MGRPSPIQLVASSYHGSRQRGSRVEPTVIVIGWSAVSSVLSFEQRRPPRFSLSQKSTEMMKCRPSRSVLLRSLASGIALLYFVSPLLGAGANKMSNPDFTAGDSIPEGAVHDWNLGATGARGWMFSDKMVTSDARQIAVASVEKNSPADGVLSVGDVILGVAGNPFSYDARTEIGRAITDAETDAETGGGNLKLIRWRDGKQDWVKLRIPPLGSYSSTAPYGCLKSERVLQQGCQTLAKRIADPGYRQPPITRSINALALLASGNSEYLPILRNEARWAAGFTTDSFKTWHYGYVITFLSEYVNEDGIIHPVMHAGIWISFGDVSGNDYWRLQSRVVFDGFTSATRKNRDSPSESLRRSASTAATVRSSMTEAKPSASLTHC